MEPINLAMFMLATIWIGPFWMLMLVQPESERTSTWMEGPWFVLGPLISYLLTVVLNPSGLIDLFSANPIEIADTLVILLGTEEGTVLAWTHMIAGDIIVTRWMWKKALENRLPILQTRLIVMMGVMLMPVGLLLHLLLNRK
jgi:hypothetical protein